MRLTPARWHMMLAIAQNGATASFAFRKADHTELNDDSRQGLASAKRRKRCWGELWSGQPALGALYCEPGWHEMG